MLTYDLAIVGSGFGGSLMALIARRLGKSVAVVEQGSHPRFAIGESSTPLANLLLEELAARYKLPRLSPLAKWGTWQRFYPEIGCGLKRGFSFFYHAIGERFEPDPGRERQLLVAASPRDEIADTHWYRADFDHFLIQEAEREGVCYIDRTTLREAEIESDGVRLEGVRDGKPIRFKTSFLVDASGPRGFLHRIWHLPEVRFRNMPRTEGLFAHFRNVRRLDEMGIIQGPDEPPYPIDDAAVHHLFPGGWIWVLRFNNGITSAGVAAAEPLAQRLSLFEGEAGWRRILEMLPTVGEQFVGSTAETPFVHVPRLSFRSGTVAGPNWAMLPSAAGFIDPLLSTGFTLNLLGISRLAEIFERDMPHDTQQSALTEYSTETLSELDRTEKLIASLYGRMNDPGTFVPLALLYFAAVSFAESARRLGRTEIGRSFLLGDHPEFARGLSECCEGAMKLVGADIPDPDLKRELIRQIDRTVDLVDVAGLGDKERRNWYPVLPQDLVNAAGKLGATVKEVESMIRRCM